MPTVSLQCVKNPSTTDESWLTWEWCDTQVENDSHDHLLDEYTGE